MSSNNDSLKQAVKKNSALITEAIMKTFVDPNARRISIRKEEMAEVIAYAYEAGANAVIEYYEN